jgi:leucyl aminopeptidase
MIDLATLTGAIIVALGQEYAGLFANDDRLAERLIKVGDEIGERYGGCRSGRNTTR